MGDILFDLVKEKYGFDTLWLFLLILGDISIVRFFTKIHFPRYLIAGSGTFIASAGLFLIQILFGLFGQNSGYFHPVIIIAIIITVLITTLTIAHYISIDRRLRQILKNSESAESDKAIIAWQQLQEIKVSSLAPWQKKKFDKRKLYLRIFLGNLKGAETDLTPFLDSDPVTYHFLMGMIYSFRGFYQNEADEFKAAEDACTGDTDVSFRMQILCNRGVGYVGLGEYKLADDYFTKAIKFGEENDISDSDLWQIVYYNYVFNKTRINPSITFKECEDLLEELKKHIDVEKPYDFSVYSNNILEFLRQTNASRIVIDEYVNQNFDYLIGRDLPIEKRCLLEASTARLVCTGRLSPEYVIDVMSSDLQSFLDIPMPYRYRCLKEIDFMFSDLRGPIVERNEKLKETAHWYLINQAVYDLDEYRSSLPSEAVFEICYCLKEKAGLLKKKEGDYKWSGFKEAMYSAKRLYEENGLVLESILLWLDMLDEAIAPVNLDRNLRSVHMDDMKEFMSSIEGFISELEKHPVLCGIYLRLCSYCYAMDDLEGCRKYYKRYKELGNYSIQHFAPWLRGKYTVMSIIVFVLEYIEAVKRILDSDLSGEIEQVQSWFKEFNDRNGYYEALVLGYLWGGRIIPVSVETESGAFPESGQIAYNSIKRAFLVIPSISAKICANKKDDVYTAYNMESDGEIRYSSIDAFPNEMKNAITHIAEMIEKEMPDYLVGKEELNQLVSESFFDTVAPIMVEM